jgi:hypothetical protein
MRHPFKYPIVFVFVIAAALIVSSAAFAQQKFDPHDLSGYWNMSNIGRPPGSLNAVGPNRPPMTPWADAKFHERKTGSEGKPLSAGVYPEKKDWNDPILWCDPPGFPRIMWHPTQPGMRLIQTPDEIIQFFEYGRVWRDLWTDGRKLTDDAESRWYGYSTAKWDGDTLVVTSTGFMEQSWLDQYGSPHSDEMRIEERYHLADQNHLEVSMTVFDAKAYTAPWVGDKKTFVRVEKPAQTTTNDLREDLCVWSETKSSVPRVDPTKK